MPKRAVGDPAAAAPSGAASDLEVRAAWHYHVEGLTQEAVARTLRISRAKVVRVLEAAHGHGIVRIRVTAPAARLAADEHALCARFGLREAVVVASAGDDSATDARVGAAAGRWLSAQLKPGLSIGVGWGATLSASADALAPAPCAGLSVVSLLGGMTHSRAVNPAAVARRMADALRADCYQLTAPLFVARAAARDALWSEPGLRDLRQRARNADIVLVSTGDVSTSATLFREGLLSAADRAGLRKAGAVADVLCHFIDKEGRVLDHPVNERAVAIALGDLHKAGTLALVSGGARKVAALQAALRAMRVAVLVTDAAAAAGLLSG